MLPSAGDRHRVGEDWGYLKTRVNFAPKEIILELALRAARHVPGNVIEFGVAQGESTRAIRRILDRLERDDPAAGRKEIFACDSFKGLPEKFEKAEVGTFAGEPPRIPGVEIVEGYFHDSLDQALARRVGKVALASLDADLYSSTLCALRWITPLLQTGSLLLFDEFLGENESEKRAFEDWSEEAGISTILVAEFLREPSGWGDKIDRRPLFQVVGPEELPPRPAPRTDFRSRASRKLRSLARRLAPPR